MKAAGMMSGTSMDAVDIAVIETDGEAIAWLGPTASYPYENMERQLLREALDSARGLTRRDDRSGVLAVAENMVTVKHIHSLRHFLIANGIAPSAIDATGFHGQTVVHRPNLGFTVQLGNGAQLAGETGIRTVFDFRAADMEAGGQGAPLVPIFHRALVLFAKLPLPALFINIGGISNLTYIPEGGPEKLIAFDAGPGNCLLDDWTLRHTGQLMDKDAKLALAGEVNQHALTALLSHPFLTKSPPKSLDRYDFSLSPVANLSPAEGAATLTAFTVACLALALRFCPGKPATSIVAGGGAKNPHIFEGLKRVLPGRCLTADEAGFKADFVEAQAFAYLAVRRLTGMPSSFPGTTGATHPVIGGIVAAPMPLQAAS